VTRSASRSAAFGVDVILIEPGLITTGFGDVASGSVSVSDAGEQNGPYAHFNRQVAKTTVEAYKGPMVKLGGGPEKVADRDRWERSWPGARRLATRSP